jgi:hypothetical protein
MDDDRNKLLEGLEAAVTAAQDAIASATDAVGSSRRAQRIARRAILDAKATSDGVGDDPDPSLDPAG